MKKNILNRIFIFVVTMTLSVACADLDLPSDGRLTYKDIFAKYPLTNNYFGSCKNYIMQFGFTYGNSTPLASYSDEAHDSYDNMSGSAVRDWYTDRTSPFSNPLTYSFNWWAHCFQGIRKCNTFLKNINDPSMATLVVKDDEKNGWIAEIRLTRAFLYLQLIKRYGGVPIIETPYEVEHDFSKDVRASFADCVDFIIADCDAALAIPECVSPTIGFHWNISDNDRGKLTRGFAWAIKSQAALYAASPLFYTDGSKYNWTYAAEITKAALDECLAHGYELYNRPVPADVAQNPYAYYFIQRSDPSRSVDKETIYESTAARTNVWKWAGTPIIEGQEKAGAGPSQELIDSYGMATSGEIPILGYEDADHLVPILNPKATDYDPAKPYEGRDPRFYASIYYNNSPRSLVDPNAKIDKEIHPLHFLTTPTAPNDMTFEELGGGSVKITVTGSDPWIHTSTIGAPLGSGAVSEITFEYKSNKTITNAEFFWCVDGGPVGGKSTGQNITIPAASNWSTFRYSIAKGRSDFGFGNAGSHFLRFDLGPTDYNITIRNMQIEVYTPPPAPTPVETFVDGNCGISDKVTDIKYTRTGYYMRKFNNYKSDKNVDADGLMKVFRLGELYMNFAEAAYQAYGPETTVPSTVGGAPMSALEAVNAIRDRVGMPKLPTGMDKNEFEIRYRNERRVEFAFEEHRFFDVRRWKILNETDNFVTGMRITKEGADYTYTRFKLADRHTNANKYLLFPIDQNEAAKMEAFTGVSWQNPDWQ